MWDRRNLPFAAIILSTVCYRTVQTKTVSVISGCDVRNVNSFLLKLYSNLHIQFKETPILMDMALDAVDDQYDGCREEALEMFIHSGLLRQELNNSESFQKAWERNTECSKLIPEGIKEHTIALSVYANEGDFIKIFDKAVETMGTNISTYENFPFKSFHFLLMDAMKLLKSSGCKSVYFVPDEEYKAEPGSRVRFGTFNTVYLSTDSVGTDLDDEYVFNITSCFFADLGDHSCAKNKNLALISPAEVFTFEGLYKKKHDDADYTEIALKHSEVSSFKNCYLFSR